MRREIQATIARTFFSNLRGLMLYREYLRPFYLPHCRAIHTCFMKFPIDIICLDEDNAVVEIKMGIPPWRVIVPHARTRSIVEVMSGTYDVASYELGDSVAVVEGMSGVE